MSWLKYRLLETAAQINHSNVSHDAECFHNQFIWVQKFKKCGKCSNVWKTGIKVYVGVLLQIAKTIQARRQCLQYTLFLCLASFLLLTKKLEFFLSSQQFLCFRSTSIKRLFSQQVTFFGFFHDFTGNASRINRRLLLWFIRTRHTCGCF